MKVTVEDTADGTVVHHFTVPKDDVGVKYWIDEGQFIFKATDFAKFSAEAMDYVSYHEHLQDQIYIATQSTKQMDVRFIRLADDFIWLQNACRKRWFKFFRGPKKIVAYHYSYLPESGDKSDFPENVAFDPDFARLYRSTERGDRGEADTQGLAPQWLWLSVPMVGLAVLFGCSVVRHARNIVSNPGAGAVRTNGVPAYRVTDIQELARAVSEKREAIHEESGAKASATEKPATGGLQPPVAKLVKIKAFWGGDAVVNVRGTDGRLYRMVGRINGELFESGGRVFQVGDVLRETAE